MLDAQNHQGKFGEDYVRVLASAAGLIVWTYDLDHDGVDLGLRRPGRLGHIASPAIEAQVKSWSRPRRTDSGDAWSFDGLNEVQFNKLAGDDFTVPRFLFLVLVPTDAREYVRFTPNDMQLRHLGYFLSLRHEPPVANPNGSRRRQVQVPLGNVLTVRSLLGLIHPDLGDGPSR